MYKRVFKRLFDLLFAILFLILFSWLYIIVAILVGIFLGTPIIFKQERTGIIDYQTGKEKIFTMYKFRTMKNLTDKNGQELPDEERLTKFGRILRATSLDEIPEVINVLKGDMSFIGPRPLTTDYIPFYTEEERIRHTIKPGLTGWAQVNGRNTISWEKKFEYDVEYVNKANIWFDLKIIILTIVKVFKQDDIGQGEKAPESLHIERKGRELR